MVRRGRRAPTPSRAGGGTLDVGVPGEASPLILPPPASTTATLAMGDALAVAVLEARGFTRQDFARSHPGGALGRKLLLHVEDLMRTGTAVPRIAPDAPLRDRKSTRLNSSHLVISYAVFCLKKKNNNSEHSRQSH